MPEKETRSMSALVRVMTKPRETEVKARTSSVIRWSGLSSRGVSTSSR